MNKPKLIAVAAIVAVLISSCQNSGPLSELQNKTWKGDIMRDDDNQELSQIKMKLSNDTLFLFSNAIFGTYNDTLLVSQFSKKDSIIHLKSVHPGGGSWNLRYEFAKVKGHEFISLYGDGYYIYLLPQTVDIFAPGELAFYEDIDVPQDPDLYLFGAYEGELEFENPMMNLFTMGYGGTKIKLVFSEGFKVKSFGQALFFNSSTSETQYYIKDRKIFAGDSKQGLSIEDGGRQLVFQSDKFNLVLRKKY